MSTLLTEFRYAIRMLLKSPGFTVIAILALALGIGANTAIFSVVNAVLLRPLPYPDADKLVNIGEKTSKFPSGSVAYPNFLDWREGQKGFTDLALVRRENFNFANVGGTSVPERIGGGRIGWNFLNVMQMNPILGQNIKEEEDVPGAPPVALISERLWKTHFGSSREVIGKQVVVDGVQREIVGVTPADLRFPRAAEIYVPLADMRQEQDVLARGNHPGFSTIGRLKPGMTLELATSDLNNIAAELERKYPETNTDRRVTTTLLLEAAVGDYRHSLNLLLGAVGCVLLIACANVANLQLVRGISRRREFAVRAALGARRSRLLRQLVTESLLLSLAGGALGLAWFGRPV